MKTLIPYHRTPFTNNFFSEFDHFFDDFLSPAATRNPAGASAGSRAHIEETDEHFLLSFDMPGVKKEDIQVEFKDRRLTVFGERGDKNTSFYAKYEQAFRLPETADIEAIEAHYENGVLQVAIPKPAQEKSRKINIQSGKNGFFSRLLSSPEKENA